MWTGLDDFFLGGGVLFGVPCEVLRVCRENIPPLYSFLNLAFLPLANFLRCGFVSISTA
jgi:hypothetical protein